MQNQLKPYRLQIALDILFIISVNSKFQYITKEEILEHININQRIDS